MAVSMLVNLSSLVVICISILIGFVWGNSQGRSSALEECAKIFSRE